MSSGKDAARYPVLPVTLPERLRCRRIFWNSRYAEPGYAYGTEPNAFLVAQRRYLQLGMTALAVADGEGRTGVNINQFP